MLAPLDLCIECSLRDRGSSEQAGQAFLKQTKVYRYLLFISVKDYLYDA
jgi:hypothetical protein